MVLYFEASFHFLYFHEWNNDDAKQKKNQLNAVNLFHLN